MAYDDKPQIQEQEPALSLDKGNIMRFYIDTSQPPESTLYRWVEVTYDGAADSSPLDVPNHWHDYHDEHTEILEGRLHVYVGEDVDGKGKGWRVVTPADGTLFIPRGVVHAMKTFDGERMILKEYASPSGRFKEAFFRDLYQQGPPDLLMGARAFYKGDAWPVIMDGSAGRWLGWLLVMILGSIASLYKPKRPLDESFPRTELKKENDVPDISHSGLTYWKLRVIIELFII